MAAWINRLCSTSPAAPSCLQENIVFSTTRAQLNLDTFGFNSDVGQLLRRKLANGYKEKLLTSMFSVAPLFELALFSSCLQWWMQEATQDAWAPRIHSLLCLLKPSLCKGFPAQRHASLQFWKEEEAICRRTAGSSSFHKQVVPLKMKQSSPAS